MTTYKRYWALYGGWRAFLGSPYLYVALLLTAVLWPLWSGSKGPSYDFASVVLSVVPSLLGFSMGGMAIMLAFSNQSIFNAITQGGKPNSYFLVVVAAFFHFILVQTSSLFLALAAQAYDTILLRGLAFASFAYALLVALATAGQLLWTAMIFNKAGVDQKPPSGEKGPTS